MKKEERITFDEKVQFNLGFSSGHQAGIDQFVYGWKQSKNLEGAIHPKPNGFVKGFIRSQSRLSAIKLTEIQLDLGRITGDQSKKNQILKRSKECFEKDRTMGFEEYKLERQYKIRSKDGIRHSKVQVPLRRQMKAKKIEMDRER